jgi:hypothetical protein
MKLKYQQAMESLQSMFQGFDQETIHSILVLHKGAIQPTIEDLLKLASEQEEAQADENMFATTPTSLPKPQGKLKSNDDFLDPGFLDAETNEVYARKFQEKEDMKLAYALQQQYLDSSQQEGGGGDEQGDEEDEEAEDNYESSDRPGFKKFGNNNEQQYQQQQGGKKQVAASKQQTNGVNYNNKAPQAKNGKPVVYENAEVITFDLGGGEDDHGYTFHQIHEGEEVKNNGFNQKFEEMKLNDDGDFVVNTSTKQIQPAGKKKNFFERLFSKN